MLVYLYINSNNMVFIKRMQFLTEVEGEKCEVIHEHSYYQGDGWWKRKPKTFITKLEPAYPHPVLQVRNNFEMPTRNFYGFPLGERFCIPGMNIKSY